MKKMIVACLTGLGIMAGLSAGQASEAIPSMSVKVCIKSACFRSEVAATPEAREMGLMFHRELAADEGMLFAFDQPGDYSFWMKNMTFPIDILWISADGRVVDIASRVPVCAADPCPLYAALETALLVLEIPAGAAERAGIAAGDRVTLQPEG